VQPLAGYCANPGAKNVIWITKSAIPGELSIFPGNTASYNNPTSFFAPSEEISASESAMPKIFSKMARRLSTRLVLFGPARPTLSRV
jgi:hypothetical protein